MAKARVSTFRTKKRKNVDVNGSYIQGHLGKTVTMESGPIDTTSTMSPTQQPPSYDSIVTYLCNSEASSKALSQRVGQIEQNQSPVATPWPHDRINEYSPKRTHSIDFSS